MFKLSDVWQAFLGWMIRFWDSRSQPHENETIYLLKLEAERNHKLLERLIEQISNQLRPEIKNDEPVELPRPLGVQSWKQRANQLTQDSIRRRRELEEEARNSMNKVNPNPESLKSIEALEQELGVSN